MPGPLQEEPLLCTLCPLGSSAAPSALSLRALSLSSSGVPSWIVSGLPASILAFAEAPPCAVQSASSCLPHRYLTHYILHFRAAHHMWQILPGLQISYSLLNYCCIKKALPLHAALSGTVCCQPSKELA